MSIAPTLSVASVSPTPVALTPAPGSASGGLSFGDVLDAVNPLQHIPVVSSVYRAVTGSHLSTGAQVAGDLLYGAALGGGVATAAATLANGVVKAVTGSDLGAQALTLAHSALGTAKSAGQPAAVALVPSVDTAPPASPAPAVSFDAKYRIGDKVIAQYQRAQVLSSASQKLVKMVL